MQTTTVGLFVGLILGLALAMDGFGSMLIVAFVGALGYLTAKVLQGELDLSELVSEFAEAGSDRKRSRR